MSSEPDALLVLGDSLCYYGPQGGLPADHPEIWPNLVTREFGWRAEITARIGWTSRDAYWALTQDPRVWAAIPRAAAVVLAIGGMDSLPSPLPTPLREQIRYIRPDGVRRRVREAYQWVQPRLSGLGWPVALPPEVSVSYLEKIREALAIVRPDLPIVATLPPTHTAAAYGYAHPGREQQAQATLEWARAHDLPVVDLLAATGDHIAGPSANPDGIHWGFDGHRNVADAMIGALRTPRKDAARWLSSS